MKKNVSLYMCTSNVFLKNNRASSSNAFYLVCFSCHVVRLYVAKIAQSLCNTVYLIDLVFFYTNQFEHDDDKDVRDSSSNCT